MSKTVIGTDRIERIRIDYRRSALPGPDGKPESDEWNYTERLILDRSTESIEHSQKISEKIEAVHKYHVADGVSGLLDSYDPEKFLTEIEGNPENVIEDHTEIKEYRVEITYKIAETRVISGSYDKRALPNDWAEFMEAAKKILAACSHGEMLDPQIYGKAKPLNTVLMFVCVRFGESDRRYTYLCDDPTVKIGDEVWAPVGDYGRVAPAIADEIKFLPTDQSPYPLEKIKSLMGRTDGPVMIPCPIVQKRISAEDCVRIGDDVASDAISVDIADGTERVEITSEARRTCKNCQYY